MPRRNLLWKVVNDDNDLSSDHKLVTLARDGNGGHKWVTVARGDPESMHFLCEVMNAHREQLFPLTETHKRPIKVQNTKREDNNGVEQ